MCNWWYKKASISRIRWHVLQQDRCYIIKSSVKRHHCYNPLTIQSVQKRGLLSAQCEGLQCLLLAIDWNLLKHRSTAFGNISVKKNQPQNTTLSWDMRGEKFLQTCISFKWNRLASWNVSFFAFSLRTTSGSWYGSHLYSRWSQGQET